MLGFKSPIKRWRSYGPSSNGLASGPTAPPRSGPRTPAARLRARMLRARQSLPSGRLVTAVIEGAKLKLVAFEGRAVAAWETMDLNEGRVRIPGRFRSYRQRTIVDASMEASLFRFLSLPPVRRRYLEDVVTAEVAETLPFPRADIDLAWAYRKSENGIDGMAVAVSRSGMDEQLRRLRQLGVSPGKVYPRATALASIAGSADVVMVHLTATKAEVTLVKQGAPRVVRVAALPEGSSPPEAAETIAAAIDWVSVGSGRSNGHGPHRLSLVVTGSLTHRATIVPEIERRTSRKVLGITSPFRHPAEFPEDDYAVNVGLAAARRVETRPQRLVGAATWAPLNLLSRRHSPKPKLVKPAAVFGALAALGVVAYLATAPVHDLTARTTDLQAQHQGLTREERSQRLLAGRFTSLQQLSQTIGAQAASAEAMPAKLLSDLRGLESRLVALEEAARPLDVRINSLSVDRQRLTLSGSSPNFSDASAYARDLRATGVFDEVQVVVADVGSIADGSEPLSRIDFQMKATLPFIGDDPTPR